MSSSTVEVKRNPLGPGVFAAYSFQPGQPILVLAGPVLHRDEIAGITRDRGFMVQVGSDQFLDITPPAGYVNHSCDPNAGILNDRVLIALRSISAGEEIRFDYSTAMSGDHWTTECRCGAPCCRRVILGFPDLPPISQNRYLQLGIVQGFLVDQMRRRSPSRRAPHRIRMTRQVSL